MTTEKYVYWKEDDMWLGYLEEFPDYWTEGQTEDELRGNLVDIYKELMGDNIPRCTKKPKSTPFEREDKTMAGALIAIVLFLAFAGLIIHHIKIDKCLDNGGSFDYKNYACQLERSQ